MNRRIFLREGIAGGILVLGLGGYLFFRRSQMRAEVTSRMLEDALPALASKSLVQLKTLPVRAREQIKRYFHGKCLNVEGFVTHICSDSFNERLGRCSTREERETCFLQAFCFRVVTDAEIVNQVETIAAEIGSELDFGWASCCSVLSGKWNTRVRRYGGSLVLEELTQRLGRMIRRELNHAARQAASGDQRPSVGETIGKLGESAVRLLPLARTRVNVGPGGVRGESNPLVVPAFFLLALKSVWEYFSARREDNQAEKQAAMSRRLALLGNRVGAEFEREVRLRLTDLHTWQENAIRQTAQRLAQERIGLV